MRDILFRGKRLDNGEWVCSGSTIHFTPEEGDLVFISKKDDRCGCVHDENDNILSIEYGTLYKVNPGTVGQYIGLTDIHGRLIFEGDIVRHYNCDEMPLKYEVGAIIWNKEKACFKRTSCPEAVFVAQHCRYEVIGNIHDNPELLV